MVYVFVIPFIVLVFLGFFLVNNVKKKKNLTAATRYGVDQFDVELPNDASVEAYQKQFSLPPVMISSAEEAFFMLVTPYFGGLPSKKRKALEKEMEELSSGLKINKSIYAFFKNEAEKYDGLNDDQASDKWRGKDVKPS